MKLMDLFQTQSSAIEIQQNSHLQMLVILKSFFSMMIDDASLNLVGEMTHALLETPAFERTAQQLKQDPASAELIQSQYIPAPHDLDRLLTYPQKSLGYQYALQMKRTNFDPNLHAGMTPKSDAHYVELRLSQTHDIWHVVTGFGVSEIDEIGLQAVHLAQFPYPLAAMLIANSLMSSTLTAPEALPQLQAAIFQGLQLGKRAKSLFSQKWEEGWEKPLVQWRKELDIQPMLAGA